LATATTDSLASSLAHLVYYLIQTHRLLSLRDFMDFLKQARWKAHLRKGQIPSTAGIWDCFADVDYGTY
jgi:hypothetical protein